MTPVIMLTASSIVLIALIYTMSESASILMELFSIVFVGLFWCWSLLGEIRLRVIRAELGGDHLIIRQYFGLGRGRVFYYSEMDVFETHMLPSEEGEYEFLVIKKNGKRIIRLSQFYHDNYAVLRAEIQHRLKGREQVPFSWLEEVKDIFGSA